MRREDTVTYTFFSDSNKKCESQLEAMSNDVADSFIDLFAQMSVLSNNEVENALKSILSGMPLYAKIFSLAIDNSHRLPTHQNVLVNLDKLTSNLKLFSDYVHSVSVSGKKFQPKTGLIVKDKYE